MHLSKFNLLAIYPHRIMSLKSQTFHLLQSYPRCLVTVISVHRNSLMIGRGRHLPEACGSSDVELFASGLRSFLPKLVNHRA